MIECKVSLVIDQVSLPEIVAYCSACHTLHRTLILTSGVLKERKEQCSELLLAICPSPRLDASCSCSCCSSVTVHDYEKDSNCTFLLQFFLCYCEHNSIYIWNIQPHPSSQLCALEITWFQSHNYVIHTCKLAKLVATKHVTNISIHKPSMLFCLTAFQVSECVLREVAWCGGGAAYCPGPLPSEHAAERIHHYWCWTNSKQQEPHCIWIPKEECSSLGQWKVW